MSDWKERLDEYGVPSEAVAAGVREVLNEQVSQLGRMQAAIASNPVLAANERAVGAFLQGDPELQKHVAAMVGVDPEAGLDYLSLRFQAAQGRPRPRGGDDHPMGSGVTYLMGNPVDESMARRGYSPSPDGVYRQTPPPSQAPPPQAPAYDHEAAKAAAWQEYQRTGSRESIRRVAKLRLREAISDEFLNQ